MMWLFGYLQLCVFGVFASVSGDFDLTMGFASFEDTGKVPDQETFHRLTTLKHWFRRPAGHMRNASSTLRCLKAASATFATSRLILFIQYLIVLHFAKKNKRDKKPLYWHLGGLLVSFFLWYGAFAAAFFDSRAAAIVRILLWTTGLAFEFFCMCAAAATQPAYRLDLEYWAERFSALTLIVLGEGSKFLCHVSERRVLIFASIIRPSHLLIRSLPDHCGRYWDYCRIRNTRNPCRLDFLRYRAL
jgi:hypothetical protein